MNKGIGIMLLNISVALYLFATGILAFSEKKSAFSLRSYNEIRRAVTAIFKGDFAEVLIVIVAILAVAAGIFIIMKLFNISIPVMELCMIILAIVWLLFIIMIDIVYPLDKNSKITFIDWLRVFAPHVMVLSGIILSTERFGGR